VLGNFLLNLIDDTPLLSEILRVWDSGHGIYTYKVVDLIHQEEALIRESILIAGYG
jgi:hypothetical protein